jgi:hypothetical protein
MMDGGANRWCCRQPDKLGPPVMERLAGGMFRPR